MGTACRFGCNARRPIRRTRSRFHAAADGEGEAVSPATFRLPSLIRMKFTDLFVRRPVLSVVVSLLILVLGVVPLVIATGPGAGGRRFMGIVIFTGLSIGTIFTLFIVPAVCLREGAAAGRRAGDN